MKAMEAHKAPWQKFVCIVAHETIHCAALTVGSEAKKVARCVAMCDAAKAAGKKKPLLPSPEFTRFSNK
uniref:SprT-like domain-containing protein n=1 Tax=Globodera pallida TaxID=36090 RepID=A0A183CRD0_GLOPA